MAIEVTWKELTAAELRAAAAKTKTKTKDSRAARRMLAIAFVNRPGFAGDLQPD